MPLPNIGTEVQTSGLSGSLWGIEWTYTGATGEVLFDTIVGEGGAWVDEDPRVLTPVADGGAGLTLIQFPKCRRVRVVHCSVAAPTPFTDESNARPHAVLPLAGTMTVVHFDALTGAANEPPVGARGRLLLMLEYN